MIKFHSAGLVLALLIALAPGRLAAVECPLIDPDGPGEDGQTRFQNFQALVDALYDGSPVSAQSATKRVIVDGEWLQAPPWFSSATECTAAKLKNGEGHIPSPSFADYAVVSDELSELAIVTALAADDTRMMEIHRTVQAMGSSQYPGLPCWLARATQVQGDVYTLDCISEDTASDATARLGLAYYFAAANESLPPASRDIYREAGDGLAARHVAVEYAGPTCLPSGVTGHQICHWIAGGSNSAAAGAGGLEMWIGYQQDIVRFLLAAYHSTGDSAYLDRAEEVVDQWLMASAMDGIHPLIGRFNFGWNISATPIVPRAGNPWWWDPNENRAWDDSDSPRALWMGDVLRAFALVSEDAPLPAAYQALSDWVEARLDDGHQHEEDSCIQYNVDGSVVTGNCGTDYYYNGLGAGLLTYHQTDWLAPKIDRALTQFDWAGKETWNNAPCFGIYRGIRPVKALASAIGLDIGAYGDCAGGGAPPPPPLVPPAAPSWLRVTAVSGSEIDLQWDDNSTDEDGFLIERKQGWCGPWTSLPNAPANATTYQSTGLALATSYAYRVRAFNAGGTSGYTNEAATSTLGCP